MFVHRDVNGVKDSPQACRLCAGEWLDKYPALSEYLTTPVWEDGKARITATLLLFVEDGMVKICVNDRANERSLWRAGETVEDALRAIETGLAGGTTGWRRNVPRKK